MLSRTDFCTRVVMLWALMTLILATTIMGFPLETNEVTLEEKEEGVWSEWRDWIPCSRSCGAGVKTQNRTCLSGSCVGTSVQYMSCCIQDCPDDHLDFRELQCQEHGHQYVVAGEGNEGCTLECVNPQVTTKSLITFVRNGTSCETVEGINGACLGSMCARVGCDGVVGSDKIKDNCLRCRSPSEEPQATCQRQAASVIPNQAPMEGKLSVSFIPAGATTITISHLLLPNEGTLALKSSLGTYDWTNGETENVVADAKFNRIVNESGPHRVEVLTSKGPISELITVELHGINRSAPMVEYEFYFVQTPDVNVVGMHGNHTVDIDDSLKDPGSEYAWQYKPFSECSVTCGTGVAVAMAICKDLKHPERNIPDEFCRRNLKTSKPFPIVQKCLPHECQPRWLEGEWSQCSRSCGNGTQTRKVQCVRFTEEGKEEEWAIGQCDPSTKPAGQRPCNMQQCYAEWSEGPWSECPSRCGRWNQTRSVVCREVATGHEVDPAHCDNAIVRPPTTQQCVVPCSECQWVPSKWRKCDNPCGYGTQTRRVKCRNVTNNRLANENCCEGQEKKPATRPCYDTRGSKCKPDWVEHYGQCQGDCCRKMTREITVECAHNTSSGEVVVFPDKECNETQKPATSEACVRPDCPRWHESEWDPCPVTCGNGDQIRDVTCVRGDNVEEPLSDDLCSCSGFRPIEVMACSNPLPCPTPPPTPPPQPCPMDTGAFCTTSVEEGCQGDPNCCEPGSFLSLVCPASCRNELNQACP